MTDEAKKWFHENWDDKYWGGMDCDRCPNRGKDGPGPCNACGMWPYIIRDHYRGNTDMIRNVQKEPLTYVKDLVSIHGVNRAAALLSISQSSVSEWIATGECRPMANLAAKAIIEEENRNREAQMLFFVKVPRDKRELFETFAKGMGLRYRTFTDE